MTILELDKFYFKKINQEYVNTYLDSFAPIVTDLHKQHWFLYYLLPTILIFWLFKEKLRAIKIILVLVLAIGVSDNLNSKVLKPLFERQRPTEVEPGAILRSKNHYGASFPSTHAANIATGATILSAVYFPLAPIYFLILFLIMWSRVYVGVHYPLDVLAGAAEGVLLGIIFYQIFKLLMKTKIKLKDLEPKKTKIKLKSKKK